MRAETGSANIILRDAVSEAIRRAACSEQSPEVTCSACVLLSSAALGKYILMPVLLSVQYHTYQLADLIVSNGPTAYQS